MAIWAGVEEHSDGHNSHTKEHKKRQEAESTHQAQKQAKARKANRSQWLVLIGTFSCRNDILGRLAGLGLKLDWSTGGLECGWIGVWVDWGSAGGVDWGMAGWIGLSWIGHW